MTTVSVVCMYDCTYIHTYYICACTHTHAHTHTHKKKHFNHVYKKCTRVQNYVLQFPNINSIIIVCMIKIIIVQLHLLEHTAPASREWEQALPVLEMLLLHSVRLRSVPVQYTR